MFAGSDSVGLRVDVHLGTGPIFHVPDLPGSHISTIQYLVPYTRRDALPFSSLVYRVIIHGTHVAAAQCKPLTISGHTVTGRPL